MNEMVTLDRDKTESILRIVIDEKIPSILSYLSRGKWHVAKVLLTNLDGNRLSIESIRSKKKQRPINIQIDQPVGISFKHDYGKFVFDTTVIGLELSPSPDTDSGCSGTIVLAGPEKMEVVQRRSYYRVEVPKTLKVKVLLWHRNVSHESENQAYDKTGQINECCQGRLLDISAGGAQIVIPAQCTAISSSSEAQEPKQTGALSFKKGQFIGLRFTPMPYETPITFSAQIRNMLPTADGQGVSLGIQIVGLEASPEGHQVLTRLIAVVGKYYQINQSGLRQSDKHTIAHAV